MLTVEGTMRTRLGRYARFTLTLGFALCLGAWQTLAQAFDYEYTSSNGTITITKYIGPGGEVSIPSSINDLPVTSIGGRAFSVPNLISVWIPESVTNIVKTTVSSHAFPCSRITVNTNNPVYSSVDGVLFDKSQTTLIQCPGRRAGTYTIPNTTKTISGFAFALCLNLTSVEIPNSVTTVGGAAFLYCINLTNVRIPASVTDWPFSGLWLTSESYGSSYAFYGCFNLTRVTIDEGVRQIPQSVFENCFSLTNITLPNSLTTIGYGAFAGCTNLTSITIPGSVTNWGVIEMDYIRDSKSSAFKYCTSLTNVTIGDGVPYIPPMPFEYCSSLTSVTVGNTVTNIGNGAFAGCANLRGVYFRGNAPSITLDPYQAIAPFAWTSNAIVYRLLGTTGWGSTFADRPTALWLPQIQTADPMLGIHNNQFGFNISWADGKTVVVQASTTLTSPSWQPVSTNTLTDGTSYFIDSMWTNYPSRFYRVRSL